MLAVFATKDMIGNSKKTTRFIFLNLISFPLSLSYLAECFELWHTLQQCLPVLMEQWILWRLELHGLAPRQHLRWSNQDCLEHILCAMEYQQCIVLPNLSPSY